MTRNLKALGLALVGCFAFAAFSASAASAQETKPIAHFTCSEYPCHITGDQVGLHHFDTGGGSMECETAHFTSTPIGGAQTSLSVHPRYEGCNLHNSILGTDTPVTMDFQGCYYTFTVHQAGTVGSESESEEHEGGVVTDFWNGDVDIKCPNEGGEGKEGPIIFRSYKDEAHSEVHCEYEITSETGKKIDYRVETGGNHEIRLNATGFEIGLKRLKGGLFACGAENQAIKYFGDTALETLNEVEEPITGDIGNVKT